MTPKGDRIYRERSTPASFKVNARAACVDLCGEQPFFYRHAAVCAASCLPNRGAVGSTISADSHKRGAKVMVFAAKGQRLRR